MLHENELNQILSWIREADSRQISEIIAAIIQRYKHVSPGWEVFSSPCQQTTRMNGEEPLNTLEFLKNHAQM